MSRVSSRVFALAIGAAGALAVLWVAELALRLSRSDPGLEAMQRARATGRPYDARSRAEVVRDLRARGIDAVPRLVPAALLERGPDDAFRSRLSIDGREVLPLSGISSRTTVLCNESGQYAIYDSDEHGFRNPRGLWGRMRADLLLLGDSFTLGDCVGPGETAADRLRARVPGTFNLGYSGNSPMMELATLVEYGPALRPATTLWMYFENDLSSFDLGRSSRTPLLRRYLEPGFEQGLMRLRPELDRLLETLIPLGLAQPDGGGPVDRLRRRRGGPLRRLTTLLTLGELRGRVRHLRARPDDRRDPPDYALLRRILERARDLSGSWEGRLVLVYVPGVWHFEARGRPPRYAPLDSRERVEAIARALDLQFIDLLEAMRAHPDPLSLYAFRGGSVLGSPHLGAAGQAHVAEVVAEQLELAGSAGAGGAS